MEQDNSGNYPVVVVRGMSHMQFASGTPPTLVKNEDLEPEITYDQAHTQVRVLYQTWSQPLRRTTVLHPSLLPPCPA